MTIPFFSRLLRPVFHFIWIFTSLLGLLAYVPFTYRQVLGINLLPWLNFLMSVQPILLSVITGALVFSIFRVENEIEDPSPEDKRELIAMMVVTLLLSFWKLPVRLINDWTALGWSFATMIPSFWLAFYDLRSTARGETVAAKSWAIVFSSIFAAAVTTLTLNYFYGQESDSTVVVVLALLLASVFCFAEQIFDRFNFNIEDKFTGYGIVLGSLLGFFLWKKVCSAIGFFGSTAFFWSFAFGICLGLALAGMSAVVFAESKKAEPDKSTLYIFIWGLNPLRRYPKLSLLLWVFWVAIIYFIAKNFPRLDWNGLLQELFAGILLLLAFFNIFFVLDQPTIKKNLTRTLEWMTAGFVVFIFAVFFIRADKLKANLTTNPIFTYAKSTLVPREISTDFYQFIQAHSNLPESVKIKLPNLSLAETSSKPVVQSKPHIFIFVIDSLRRDYLSQYNAKIETPEVQKFAEESIVFTNAFTRFGATGLSEPSIWAGRMIPHQMYPKNFSDINTLEKLADAEDYKLWISRDSILKEILKSEANENDLDRGVGTQDLDFCKTSAEIINRLKENPKLSPVLTYSQSQNIHVSVLARGHTSYEDEVKRIDQCLGVFKNELEKLNLLEKSIVVLTSDHGDSMGEEGRYGHAYTIYPEVLRIPLIMRLPKTLKEQVMTQPERLVFSTDLAPSLEMLLGRAPKPKHWSDGVSLFFAKNEQPVERLEDSHLVMSSYGPVAGILSEGGTKIYISDGVNFNDYMYEINEKGAANFGVTPDAKLENEKLIREKLLDLYNYYGVRL